MTRKVQVTPGGLTRSVAGFTAGLAVLFLVFGLVLLLGTDDGGEEGLRAAKMVFLLIWVAACIGVIVFNLRVFRRPKDPAAVSLFQLEEEADGEVGRTSASAFDDRLRKLKGLHDEGLISDEEFRCKRAEILKEKW
jgi:hypothetical protein